MARKAVPHSSLIISICLLLSIPAAADYKINYIHTDHRGAPVAMTDQSQAVIWRASYKPFGEAILQEDPDGDGVNTVMNIRYPGQYYDQESGTYYNYYRDYDPGLGRYIQSDPIGLRGGLNTYGYVYQNPLLYTDPYGLAPDWVGPAGWVVAAAGGSLLASPLGGHPYGATCGLALVVIGGGLTAWDYATTPTEISPELVEDLLETERAINGIQEQMHRINGR
jgi:RHS repeat-associated protein